MTYIGYNLKSDILVKLTERAFVLWKEQEDQNTPDDVQMSLRHYKAKMDENGYIRFRFWYFMQLFGPHIYMGGPELFDLNVLLVEPTLDQIEL
ncbi:hypothetical protein [Spirosoma flavum]|uniref:Uncharacterized protein n=1 Tax=Spirosoma flavum TaxID=2048557 RepID=A0ABW6APU8_9BACT